MESTGFTRDHTSALLFSLILVCLACTACGASRPTASEPAVRTSKTDAFLKRLIEQVRQTQTDEARLPGRIDASVDWQSLTAKADEGAGEPQRKARRGYVAFWRTLAKLYDFGALCTRPCYFEACVRDLLSGKRSRLLNHRLLERLGVASFDCDPAAYRRYLLNEELPAWASTLRYVAAGVLAGEGDREAMNTLVEAASQTWKEGSRGVLGEAELGARTEKALGLWKELAESDDKSLRAWATRNIAGIRSDRAVGLLVARLKDSEYDIRRAAAMALMERNNRAAADVLMEVVERGPVEVAPICVKLEEWQVPGVPWERIEAHLGERAKRKEGDYWAAIRLAGFCLAAGREEVALPFLEEAMTPATTKIARLMPGEWDGRTPADVRRGWHAAKTLVANGNPAGISVIGRYVEIGGPDWCTAYNGLKALAAFLAAGRATAEEREAIMSIARKTYERRDELFHGYVGSRGFEALGELGALCRVRMEEGQIEVREAIPLAYDMRYGPHPYYAMAGIYRAKVRSVIASARQEGIDLPVEWLKEYRQSQRAIIERLAARGDPAVRAAAKVALEEVAEEEQQ